MSQRAAQQSGPHTLEGTQTDGERLEMAGVIVCGVRDDAIAWARVYVEPVEEACAGIDAAVRDMTAQP